MHLETRPRAPNARRHRRRRRRRRGALRRGDFRCRQHLGGARAAGVALGMALRVLGCPGRRARRTRPLSRAPTRRGCSCVSTCWWTTVGRIRNTRITEATTSQGKRCRRQRRSAAAARLDRRRRVAGGGPAAPAPAADQVVRATAGAVPPRAGQRGGAGHAAGEMAGGGGAGAGPLACGAGSTVREGLGSVITLLRGTERGWRGTDSDGDRCGDLRRGEGARSCCHRKH
ncbi:hypothetical protein VTK73DRAFT_5975 [Phialemonium thermophilum]|uniref:Uncharacterized protein n=1 Tax=Phialemonium thermophilum TaxID=223376 RepID=A0ABR3V0E9_9PEZI